MELSEDWGEFLKKKKKSDRQTCHFLNECLCEERRLRHRLLNSASTCDIIYTFNPIQTLQTLQWSICEFYQSNG